MSENMFLGILSLFFTPAFALLGWILKQNHDMGKRLDKLNGIVARHDIAYKACPFCPEKGDGKS